MQCIAFLNSTTSFWSLSHNDFSLVLKRFKQNMRFLLMGALVRHSENPFKDCRIEKQTIKILLLFFCCVTNPSSELSLDVKYVQGPTYIKDYTCVQSGHGGGAMPGHFWKIFWQIFLTDFLDRFSEKFLEDFLTDILEIFLKDF